MKRMGIFTGNIYNEDACPMECCIQMQPNEQVSTYGPLQKICHDRCIDCVCPCPEKLKDDVGGVVH